MKKLLLFILFFAFVTANSQNQDWQRIDASQLLTSKKVNRNSIPKSYVVFSLDLENFKSQLDGIPVRGNFQTKSAHIISLPNPDGTLSHYDVIETPIMEKGLEEKFPLIKSYAAQGIDDPTAIARFSVTQFGLHSMTFTDKFGIIFIDPFTEDRNHYIVYQRDELQELNTEFKCLTGENEMPELTNQMPGFTALNTNDKRLRTYRLALSCNGEYGTIFKGTGTVAQQKANVQAQMAITMTRVNGVYEKELAITMVFVATNDQIIYLDAATDPWNGEFNLKTAQTIDSVIGVNNYDIGHNFNTSGGGNAGCIGCVCTSVSQAGTHKGRGYTGHPNPTGDPFDIDYVAHEMGHQFGGYHTQSNDTCRSGQNTEVETGSGSSIMGYAGICSANVQNNSDAYFAYVNIRDISTNVQSGASSSCAVITNFPNNPPAVNAGADYTIPKSTPFILTATGSDPDGNALTYCWEQRDPEAVLPAAQNNAAPTATRTAGPMFRTLPATVSQSRSFPNMTTVLSGATSNTWEVLPSIARTFNFSVTARDNVAGGGQTASDLMIVNVNAVAGPFVVNSPNTNVSWQAGSNQTVTWDVAGTIANGINCAYVDIYMSSNGGTSFPTLLASKVPNDGTQTVTIPNSTGTTNRIMVRGNGNIFYDVSNTNFTTTSGGSTFSLAFSGIEGDQNKSFCQGNGTSYTLNYATLGGFSNATTFSVTGNPSGTTASFSPTSGNTSGTVTLNIGSNSGVIPGFYTLTVTGTSGATTKTVQLYLEVLNGNFAAITPASPVNEAYAQPLNVTLNWNADTVATLYDVEVATNSDFANIIRTETVTTNSYFVSGLSPNSNYFWRVLPKNSGCEGQWSNVFRFTTGSISCPTIASTNVPLTISATGTPTINSTINIPTAGAITDVNVTVQITHPWISDLTVSLISPTGTTVQLVVAKCGSNDNINATFDDAGVVLVCGTIPAMSGNIRPAQLLSALNGQSTQGVWTLRIADSANGDGGSLTAWSLNICSIPNQPLTCGALTTTWNGSEWSNGKPVSNVAAIIQDDFTSTENLQACSLNVTQQADAVIASGHNFTIDGTVTVAPTASLTVANDANLIQIQNVQNTGNIVVNRNASMKRLDYTYWSSPVEGQNLLVFSPETIANRFYILNEATNVFETINPAINNFMPPKGYSIRAPNTFTTQTATFNGVFSGVPNNGNFSQLLGSGFSLIGNPYPSTIDADLFLDENPGSLYFWTHIQQGATAGTNYATYTELGGTAATLGGQIPNGTIQTGQGFVFDPNAAGNVDFLNSMRVKNNSGQFYRAEKHRIWLNLNLDSEPVNQILIGYMTNATYEIDASIDAKIIGNETFISSLIDNENFVIQGRALPFEATDVVPLALTTSISGTYKFSIDHVDGLFLDGQEVFIKDNLTNTIHNLNNGEYWFASTAGTFNDRFAIVYQGAPLDVENPGLSENALVVFKKEATISINSGNVIVKEVKIFDIRGRLLQEKNNVNATATTISDLNIARQVLIVQVKDNENKIVSKKIVY